MKISIDTKEDSHEEISKVIKMLQNLVGENQETFTNQPEPGNESSVSPFANIFGDASVPSTNPLPEAASPEAAQETEAEETSQSAEDLFAELFSEEELKKMDIKKESEDEEESEEEVKSKDKKYGIELY